MKNFFTKEDFLIDLEVTHGFGPETASHIANEKLYAYIKTLPKAYGYEAGNAWTTYQASIDTHFARLIDVQEIKSKECEHKIVLAQYLGDTGECEKCGIKMRRTWEPE